MSKDSDSGHGSAFPNQDHKGTSNGKELLVSQPRPPKDLKDLLRYSSEVAGSNDHSGSENAINSMTVESKKFLEEAIKSVTVDVIGELFKCIEIIKNADLTLKTDDITASEEALDCISDYIENMDVANDFEKIGGFCIIEPCLKSAHSTVKSRGAELIAKLCQNNPYCQNKILNGGYTPYLLGMIDTDMSDEVRIKALYAVSCLARQSEDGFNEFVKNDGFSVLLRALQSDVSKLNIKSAFLISSLCHSNPNIRGELINMGFIEQIISQLTIHAQMYKEGHSPILEHLLNALLGIVDDYLPGQVICQKVELGLKDLIDFILESSARLDEQREVNDYAARLKKIIFEEQKNVVEDR